MKDYPTGTLTFLFTDIESSTELWERYPDAMCTALARHDAIIERCVDAHHGMLVRPRGEGDSRFAVFPHAEDGVRAASGARGTALVASSSLSVVYGSE